MLGGAGRGPPDVAGSEVATTNSSFYSQTTFSSMAGTPKGVVRASNTFNTGTLPVTFETWANPPSTDGGVFGQGEPMPLTPLRHRALRCIDNTCWFGGERGAILRRTW